MTLTFGGKLCQLPGSRLAFKKRCLSFWSWRCWCSVSMGHVATRPGWNFHAGRSPICSLIISNLFSWKNVRILAFVLRSSGNLWLLGRFWEAAHWPNRSSVGWAKVLFDYPTGIQLMACPQVPKQILQFRMICFLRLTNLRTVKLAPMIGVPEGQAVAQWLQWNFLSGALMTLVLKALF